MTLLEVSSPSWEELERFRAACDAFLKSFVQPLLIAGVSIDEINQRIKAHPEHKRLTEWSNVLDYRREKSAQLAKERRFLESIEANRERWQRMVNEGRYSYTMATRHWFGAAYNAATGRCHLQGLYCEPELMARIEPLTCRVCGYSLMLDCAECQSPFGKDLQ